ncbi:hypothetical protein PG997_002613 [Apiospora hydei]|uniref:Uncharacterized protein n=1 Tax=Apiospora hydei TaxID=1337664 RepID=A0ABR1WWV9_9PEZI
MPGHFVCLGSNQSEQEYWYNVMLDTKHGVILVEQLDPGICPDLGIPQCTDVDIGDEDYELPEMETFDEATEVHYEVYAIRPFFEACEQKLRSLEWCPDFWDHSLVEDAGDGLDRDAMAERRGIIRDAGWPAEKWNKDVAQWMIRELDGERDLDAEEICKPDRD